MAHQKSETNEGTSDLPFSLSRGSYLLHFQLQIIFYTGQSKSERNKMRCLFSPLSSHLLLLLHTSLEQTFPPQETFHPCYISTGLHADTLDVNLVNQIHYPLVCLNRTSKLSVVFCVKPQPYPDQVIILFFQLQIHSSFSHIQTLVAVWLVQRGKHQSWRTNTIADTLQYQAFLNKEK